jgi:hypothetical protein
MRIRYSLLALGLAITYPTICVAGTVSCISAVPQKTGAEQGGMAVGTVVGVVVGAYATDGDVSITLLAGDLGCNAGSAVGKVYLKADNSAMALNGKLYAVLHTTPQQGIIRFIGIAEGTPAQQPKEVEVVSISPGYNLIVMPLADKTMQQLGVSEADRKNILVLAAPPSPANIAAQGNAIKKAFGF